MQDLRLGVSAASSWAWGTSLVVGMEIAQTKGLLAFGIWATANAAALAVFGMLAPRIKAFRAFERPAIHAGALRTQSVLNRNEKKKKTPPADGERRLKTRKGEGFFPGAYTIGKGWCQVHCITYFTVLYIRHYGAARTN
jgi:hypothetical protein